MTARNVAITVLDCITLALLSTLTQIGLTLLTGSRDAGYWLNQPACFVFGMVWVVRWQKRFGGESLTWRGVMADERLNEIEADWEKQAKDAMKDVPGGTA